MKVHFGAAAAAVPNESTRAATSANANTLLILSTSSKDTGKGFKAFSLCLPLTLQLLQAGRLLCRALPPPFAFRL